MRLIFDRYKHTELDKIDITLLKGLYKFDPNEISSSSSDKSSESLNSISITSKNESELKFDSLTPQHN